MKPGAQANENGNILEHTIKQIFVSKGFQLLRHKDYQTKQPLFNQSVLLTHVPFQSIYEHRGNTEFLAVSSAYQLNLRIECKWQQSKGSVDEKLPYLYLNCIERMPEKEMMIVIDGPGFKKGAIEWLRSAAKNKWYTSHHNRSKTVHVFNLSEFVVWANTRLRTSI